VIVVVSGARVLKSDAPIRKALDLIQERQVLLMHGAAEGADKLAASYGHERGWTVIGFPAAWDIYDKAAGPIRNAEMLLEALKTSKRSGRELRLYAFPVTKSGGTRNCIAIARTFRIATTVVEVTP
jgi:hypothetical protein